MRYIASLKAALGLLIVSVTASFAAPTPNIVIQSLPYTISAPGTYVLARNLNFSGVGISIVTNLSGPVIVDLKGFTITGAGTGSTGVQFGTGTAFQTPSNYYPITIRNGKIANVSTGVLALASPQNNEVLSNLTISGLTISTVFTPNSPAPNVYAIQFYRVKDSSVKNCKLVNATIGIDDLNSLGNNSYTNIAWENVWQAIVLDQNQDRDVSNEFDTARTGVVDKVETGPVGN
jgi:hypothetical protein